MNLKISKKFLKYYFLRFLRLFLTGEFFSEISDASGTLWLDIKQRKWSNELLSSSFLEEKHMPKLSEGNQSTGILKKSIKDKFGFNK